MRYTISIAVLNNLALTKKCLALLEANSGTDYELIISDNASTDGTAEFLAEYCQKHRSCRVVTYPYNTGFGHPHNQALNIGRGEYFVVLNNDIFIHEKRWLQKLETAFTADPRLAIAGFAGNHSGLTDDGVGTKDPAVHEYVEASCMMMPRRLAEQYGLFSAEYELAYREDADLSLRYRQMGFGISLVRCEHEHVNNATAFNLDQGLLSRVKTLNKKTFLNRWSDYLRQREFKARVLVRAEAEPLLLLQATAVLKRLKEAQPLVRFDIGTNRPEVFRGNPAVADIFHLDGTPAAEAYDRVVTFDFAALPKDRPVALGLAVQAAIHPGDLRPVLGLDEAEMDRARALLPGGRNWVLLDRQIPERVGEELIGMLNDSGHAVAVIAAAGNGEEFLLHSGQEHLLDLRGFAAVAACCKFVIARAGLLPLFASSQSVPTLLFLDQGDSPWISGMDPADYVGVGIDSAPDVLRSRLSALEAGVVSGNLAWLRAELLKREFQYENLLKYYNVDLDSRISENIEMANYYRQQTREMLDHVYASTSWRITAPLRGLHRLISRLIPGKER